MIKYKGDGSSKEQVIIILGVEDEFEGADAEYDYLETLFGEQNVNWRLAGQTLITENDKIYDVLVIEDKNQRLRNFWYDITSFYGK